MPRKEVREKYYKEKKCVDCGKPNELFPLKHCPKCKATRLIAKQSETSKEWHKNYETLRLENQYYKNRRLKRADEKRCISCGRPLLMEEKTKKCKMCSEKQFRFKWD